MDKLIKKYPVRTGIGFGITASIGFYAMPPMKAKIQAAVLIGLMGGGLTMFYVLIGNIDAFIYDVFL